MFKGLLVAGLAVVASGALVLSVVSRAPAEEKDKAKEEAPRKAPSEGCKAVERIAVAGKLIQIGREDKSPASLILAAEILYTTGAGSKPGKHVEVKEVGKAIEHSPEAAAKKLLAEASKMAGGDEPAVKALAERLAKMINDGEKGRSPSSGFFSVGGFLNPNSGWQNVMNVTLNGGENTAISLQNLDNSSDLDVRVFDPSNNLVAQDVRTDPNAYVNFFVPQAGRYRVEIRNYSGPGARYNLTAN